MREDEIFDYYDEHWNDYNKVMDMLHNIVDSYESKIRKLEKELEDRQTQGNNLEEIAQYKTLLQECQDKLDEETHRLL